MDNHVSDHWERKPGCCHRCSHYEPSDLQSQSTPLIEEEGHCHHQLGRYMRVLALGECPMSCPLRRGQQSSDWDALARRTQCEHQ